MKFVTMKLDEEIEDIMKVIELDITDAI